jgi:hypothetical protein
VPNQKEEVQDTRVLSILSGIIGGNAKSIEDSRSSKPATIF